MAAEPKTRPTDASVPDFIAAVENPIRRADAEAICAMMGEATAEPPVLWGASIIGFGSYRSPTGDWPLVGFSPRKANLVLYVMPGFEGQSDLLARLGKHKAGGSCLYLNRLADIDRAVLRQIIDRSVASMRARYGG
ncbi:DUF1801 domain-containing protein [Brevundimonas sp.]|uniref:DUF1801 domain-containing protein n=1 Tax=Brevundimonas sp. TaxID=1871086 RepID=UPI00199109A7|nr:DUF1801 domain-containing protein [Brevundimonas sp.]MBD3838063.1 DUF1801 domain-containing protein [Brevundimonas sp.]